MTIHTRYRATMQVALGEVIAEMHDSYAPTSELGTQALRRLERKGFTLTALPVDDHARDTAAWGLVDAWDDEADSGADKLTALAPWVQQLTEIMTAVGRPTDEPGETDPERIARLFHETYERLAPSFGYETRMASAVPWDDVPDQNKRLMVAVAGEVRALVGGRSAPTRDEIAEAIAESITEHVWAHGTGEIDGDGIGEAAEAVVALLSRSAAEPPAQGVLAADLVEQGWRIVKLSHARTHGLVDHDIVVEEWDEADGGVAAEPNEEHDDG